MRTKEGKVKVYHPRSKSKASQTRKRREGFSVPTGISRFEKVFALYISPAGLRGRTEEQIMLNQARYFLPGITSGTTPLTGERAQAILRGRPRGRLGTVGSGKGCLRGRPRGRFGMDRSETAPVPHRLVRLGSTHGAGAIL